MKKRLKESSVEEPGRGGRRRAKGGRKDPVEGGRGEGGGDEVRGAAEGKTRGGVSRRERKQSVEPKMLWKKLLCDVRDQSKKGIG